MVKKKDWLRYLIIKLTIFISGNLMESLFSNPDDADDTEPVAHSSTTKNYANMDDDMD